MLSGHVFAVSQRTQDLGQEIRSLISDIEGIEVKRIGQKIAITGNVWTQKDVARLQMLEKKYPAVLNMSVPMDSAKALHLETMIHMDVKVIEINKNKLHHLGFETSQPFQANFGLLPKFESQSEIQILLHALEQKGYAKTLSNPKILCKTGEEAVLTSGGEIPVKIVTQHRAVVEWKTYGIILKIKPVADREKNIATSIIVEVSSIHEGLEVNGIPSFHTRRLKTFVNVRSGTPIILSGLLYEEKAETSQGLSPFSAIPILGALFTLKQWTEKETELLIWLTPKIYE